MKRNKLLFFIEKANDIHSNKYNYNNSIYINNRTPLSIECKIHGEFKQRPDNHLNGGGCNKCAIEFKASNRRKSLDMFLKEANEIHINKYDYSFVNYINIDTKISIVCDVHGLFNQTPYSHIKLKNGCPACSGNKKHTNESIIQKFTDIHGDIYNYDNLNYINSNTEVVITCKLHGIFLQKPYVHLRSGCPSCFKSNGELKIEKYLSENKIVFEKQKKFDSCKNIRLLPFDFYIVESDILIEFDGQQHFYPVEIFGGDKSFKQLKKNDKIKDAWAYKNNKKLIRISYKDNVIEKLKEVLNTNINI